MYNQNMNELMHNKLKNLPEEPGCYMYRNASGDVIYVGKAKNLKNRVRTYFHSADSLAPKTRKMISEAENLEYFITDSEIEAFMLETNLIKEYRPTYNILMKDDKNYPYIKLTLNEKYPRLIITRKRLNDKCRYFGPYLNAYDARRTIDAIHRFYPMQICGKNTDYNHRIGKVCLNYHIGLCSGVCTGQIPPQEYDASVQNAKAILSGDYTILTDKLYAAMYEASEKMNYEAAKEYKELIGNVTSLFVKQKINDSDYEQRDIIGLYCEGDTACAIVFNVREGKLTNTQTIFMSADADSFKDVTEAFINQYYTGTVLIPKEIIIKEPYENLQTQEKMLTELRGGKTIIRTVKKGDKKRLLDMAENNARLCVETRKSVTERKQQSLERCLNELNEVLKPAKPIYRIESFDISNISGTENVGVMVVYENAKYVPKGLRKFRIKYTSGQDDYAATSEVLFRRLSRAKTEIDENVQNPKFLPLPQIIFADGGKAHVNVMKSIIEDFGFDIAVAGLVKDNRHKLKAVITQDNQQIPLKEFTYSKLLLNEISEQVHKQAIGYHRLSRSKTMLKGELTQIDGIGETRAINLMKHFGSIEAIRKADTKDIAKVDGMSKAAAEKVKEALKSKEQ